METFEKLMEIKGLMKNDFSTTMYRKLEFIYKLLTYIKSFECTDGISYITKNQIAEYMGCSRSLIYKTIKILSQDGKMIDKIGKSQYKVYQTDIVTYGPFAKYIVFLYCTQNVPHFLELNWKQQASFMGIQYSQMQRIYSWVYIGLREMKGKY